MRRASGGTSFRWLIAVVVVCAALPATASANVVWGQAQGFTLPTGAGAQTQDDVVVNQVSCPSDGNCAVVGAYQDGSNTFATGFTLTESGGVWGSVTTVKDPGVNGQLNDVSCWSAGDCVAVGAYETLSGSGGLIETETNGTWNAGFAPPVPSDAVPNSGESLLKVGCSSAGACLIVGTYQQNFGNDETQSQAVILSGSGSSYSLKTFTLPSGAAPSGAPAFTPSSVSCSSGGYCGIGGYYDDTSGDQQGVILNETAGGAPSLAIKAPLPGDAMADPDASVQEASCSGTDGCSFYGIYSSTSDQSFTDHALLWTDTSGSVGAPLVVAFPDSGTNGQGGTQLSCTAPGVCGAGISYLDGANNAIQLQSESGGTWGAGTPATLPSNVDAEGDVDVFGASCADAGDCAVVGSYNNTSFLFEGLLVSEVGGTWQPGVALTLPSGSGATSESDVRSVSCSSADVCVASGEYSDASGNWFPYVVSSSNVAVASPTLALAAPSSGMSGTAIGASAVSATLAGGNSPTGTVTFRVFGPQASAPTACGTGGTVVGTASASGDGTYHPSAPFTPSAAGTYWWYASYAGDSLDNPAATACGSAMASTVVTSSSTGTKPTPGKVSISGSVAVSSKGVAGVKLSCSGGACSGKLSLIETVKTKGKAKTKPVTLGSASYSLTAGKSETVSVKLSGAGAKAVASAPGRKLKVTASAKPSSGATVTKSVTLTGAKKATKKK